MFPTKQPVENAQDDTPKKRRAGAGHLWVPVVLTLLAIASTRFYNYRQQEAAIVKDLVSRKSHDAHLITDLLASRLAGKSGLSNIAKESHAVLFKRHRNTLITTYLQIGSGRTIHVADNRDDIDIQKFDGIVAKISGNPDFGDNAYTPKGLRFKHNDVRYVIHRRFLFVSPTAGRTDVRAGPIIEVSLVTNIDTATLETRNIALFWGSSIVMVAFLGLGSVVLISIIPFEKITLSVLEDSTIQSRWYWPAIATNLGIAIEGYKRQSREALAISQKLSEEIAQVNQIAVHDIKAALIAINQGSDVIIETLEELNPYLEDEKISDEVLLESLETISFFARLNIVSASSSYDILDNRNRLFDLESKIEIAPCSVSDIFKSLEASFIAEPGEFITTNKCPESRQILADYSLLISVLSNIIRNGFIHNDSLSKRVTVTVEPHDHHSRITITDNGVGMPPDYLQHWGKTLGKSAQLEDRGGSGTGLYSIRKIVEAHPNSTIKVSSAVNQGTTFTLEFPHAQNL